MQFLVVGRILNRIATACRLQGRAVLVTLILVLGSRSDLCLAEEKTEVAETFKRDIRPVLMAKCFSCHADGGESGGISFDVLESEGHLLNNIDVWHRVLKNVRAGLMPPADEEPLTADEKAKLDLWIKRQALGLDPAHPDPGRVTIRRLNRIEYQNTVRDVLGVRFDVDEQFPPDDTGHGFDNIADVLTVSPMLLEKYMAAANTLITEVVPTVPLVPNEVRVPGGRFARGTEVGASDEKLSLSYYEPAVATHTFDVKVAGTYKVVLEYMAQGRYAERAFDYNRAEVAFFADDKELYRKDFGWQNKQEFRYEYEHNWQPGAHTVRFEVKPLTEIKERPGELKMHLQAVSLVGPMEEGQWVKPRGHDRWFGKEPIPDGADGRRARAGAILRGFATKAFRRPADAETVDRLVSLAEGYYGTGDAGLGQTFEAGVAHAMIAVLASPRFLFLEETVEPVSAGEVDPLIDEYSLASRLSYFLWSSAPDEQLMTLAGSGELRKNLTAQVRRMLSDRKAAAFFENFPGQWLQSRDVERVAIERNRIMDRDVLKKMKVGSDGEFGAIRTAMRVETEQYFAYVVREDRSVLELVDSQYTFLNEKLADFYGVPGVQGANHRKVDLPADSPRGGVLTMGTVLMVTSNPTRTSPVKRGLFVLENILGTPPPPPPPNIPALEDASKVITGRTPSLRETLELHRSNADCMSCHTRLDPPGLALENFNAIGVWRDADRAKNPIDATGQLITGEEFKDIRELKKILVTNHKSDIYHCVTEKLLTYALGRGMEYYDVETVDQIAAGLDRDGGRFSALLMGIVDSAAFQRRRGQPDTRELPTNTDASAPSNR